MDDPSVIMASVVIVWQLSVKYRRKLSVGKSISINHRRNMSVGNYGMAVIVWQLSVKYRQTLSVGKAIGMYLKYI